MRTIFIHVGLPKTATSFLQGAMFPQLRSVHYLHPVDKKIKESILQLKLEELSAEDCLRIREALLSSVSLGKNILLSNEGFSGEVFIKNSKDRMVILADLQKICIDFRIKIIVGIREQSSLLSSLYTQYVHEGGTRDLAGFFEQMGEYHHGKDHLFGLFDYTSYVDLLVKLFGRENVYVYVYEQLQQDQQAFLRGLLDFLGEKEVPALSPTVYNRGYGVHHLRLARFGNRFFKSPLHPSGLLPQVRLPLLGRLSPRLFLQNRLALRIGYKKYQMPEETVRWVRERYRKDNLMLDNNYNLQLPSSYFNVE